MRITQMFAVLLAVLGFAAVTPVSATTTTRVATAAPTNGAAADQYRSRSGSRSTYGRSYGYRSTWRGSRSNWRGNRLSWRGSYSYRPRYYAYRPRWRSSGLVCRTSWRWGRPHRVCFRRW